MEDVAAAAGITKLIVYRHFASKQELYDAVLEGVSERLREAFVSSLAERPRLGETAVHALLVVAREDPAAFTLLWRHAVREPQFAAHADSIRRRIVAGVEQWLEVAPFASERRTRRWAAATLVSYVVAAVLHWLEEGAPAGDADFEARMSRSLPALVTSWG
jgi:AcrR family transcriptional regulator